MDALELRAGEWVSVRSEAEIRATLDARGELDGLPFQSEMRRSCGRRFRVFKRADRVCVEGQPTLRRLRDTVFLDELRCDGSAHGGCERGCLFFWKEAWLARARAGSDEDRPPGPEPLAPSSELSERAIGRRFYCQSTELARASAPVRWWNPWQYARDVMTGNLTASALARSFFSTAREKLRPPIAPPDAPARTPAESLALRPGEWVEIKPLHEIRRTLDAHGKNRGLELAPGMPEHCGERHRVKKRVEAMIVEADGIMRRLRDTVVLDELDCDGMCSRGCPRKNHLLWREIWLRRV